MCHPAGSHISCASMDADEIPQFPFPYQPYPIQEQFMRALYVALEDSKVGIFESPTGTVGALSVGSERRI